MDNSSSGPIKKKKSRSEEYKARKATKRRLKGENARSQASRIARRDRNKRRSDRGLANRKNINKRRSDEGLANRSERNKRRSDEGLANRRLKKNRRRNNSRLIGYNDLHRQVDEFEQSIREGPTYLCQCCGGLFFFTSIQTPRKASIEREWGDDFQFVFCLPLPDSEVFQLDTTCARDIKKKKVPKLCLNNGFWYQDQPDCLAKLSLLEERLVAPRLPFMQIRELLVGKQYKIRGGVVNVPVSVDTSVNKLPRTFDQTNVVQILLKRKKEYKTPYMNEIVKPANVYDAAQFLVNQPLYIKEEIKLNIDWNKLYNEELQKFIVEDNDKRDDLPVETDKDNWDETIEDQPVNPNKDETLLKESIVLAPGEGERPVSLLSDKCAEELSFPKIFCGHERHINVNHTYNDICKSELRRYDRRCCNAPNILYKYRVKEIKSHAKAIRTCIRKGYLKEEDFSVKDALKPEFVSTIINDDLAYKVLEGDRSSPAFWQAKMKELMAMIRQIGIPTLFLTLSAAETQWAELLVILVKVLHNKDVTEEEVMTYDFVTKCDLIREDPVTTARYFDHRVRQLFKIIKSSSGPFSPYEVLDTYVRVEFQSRGSPHVHCLIWLKGAPEFIPNDQSSLERCEVFIDSYISCRVGTMNGLEKLQYHKHSPTCKKSRLDDVVCRFGIPNFPMSRTRILKPLKDEELTEDEYETFDHIMDRIEKVLGELDVRVSKINNKKRRKDNKDVVIDDQDQSQVETEKELLAQYSYEEFLANCDVDEETYIRVIRNQLKRPKVFLKRNPIEVRTNAYSPLILSLHRANMDLQFVLDAYSCVHYILNYINKSDRGMSDILRNVVQESKEGNLTHRQRLYRICSKFINCSEVSVQEAVYILLGMPLSRASRESIFINTGERDNRTRIMKINSELQKLDPNSKDIWSTGLLDYYVKRPEELEDCCLADFAAKYKKHGKKTETNDDCPDVAEEVDAKAKRYHLMNDLGVMVEKKRPRIIRYRKYQLKKDPVNFYREKVMLYLPWRNEDTDIILKDCKNLYEENKEMIFNKEKEYVFNAQLDLDEIEEQVDQDTMNFIKSNQEDMIANKYKVLDLENHDVDFENEIGNRSNNEGNRGLFLSPTFLNDDIYLAIIRSLNERQRNFLLGLMNHVKTSSSPFYYFLTGGAGTGKSLLIKAIYQSLFRWYNQGTNPDEMKVLIVAPTGKAAFNVHGTTIHSAFHLATNENCREFKRLNPDLKNTLRKKLWRLKVIIIDEISMVGTMVLSKLDFRLKDIFNTDENFGGISILFVGDFNQLQPVKDRFVFQTPNRLPYGALAGPILWSLVRFYKLDQIMRQKDDLIFAGALNRAAKGEFTDDDRKLFHSRLFPKGSPELPREAIRLYSTNQQVDTYNSRILRETDGDLLQNSAFDFTAPSLHKRVRDQALFMVAEMNVADTYGLPKNLLLKKGCQYMISTNIDIQDGLVNGTSGILREVDTNNGKVSRLWFDFGEIDTGHIARSKLMPVVSTDGRPLTPINQVIRDIQTKTESKFVLVSRKQFPLRIAEAITIHKSQGQTYDKVVIDMSRKHRLAAFYTSFSRAKTLNGLYLVGTDIIFPEKRQESNPVKLELDRLEEVSLIFEQKFLRQLKKEGQMAIYFQNLPWLFKHGEDLSCDVNIQVCDMLALVETRSSHVNIDGFDLRHSLEFKDPRPLGINFYTRTGLDLQLTAMSDVILGKDSQIEYVKIDLRFTLVFIFYISPKFPKTQAMANIESMVFPYVNRQLFIVGDWNINVTDSLGEKLRVMFQKVGLTRFPQERKPSTDRQTQIDYAFSNMAIDDSFYYESIVSDHKSLITLFQK